MLRLWRDQVRIALCPDRVITVHYRAGLRPRIVAKQVRHYSAAEPGWQAALPVLQSALANPDWENADATLILSNHFMRFLLLPWSDVALTGAEKLSLLQHRFNEVYGEASATWELRLNEGSFAAPSLASAVDRDLLGQLQGIFKASPLRLKSIQPYLMSAFNVCRRDLGNGAAWLVLVEQGMSCIGLLHRGQWQSIRLRRTGSDWFDETMLALEREILLADHGKQTSKVLVYAPEHPVPALLKRGALTIHAVLPDARAALAPGDMGGYAMAAAGI